MFIKVQFVAEVTLGTAWKLNESETNWPIPALNILLFGFLDEIYGRSEAEKLDTLMKNNGLSRLHSADFMQKIFGLQMQKADIKPSLRTVHYCPFILLIRPVLEIYLAHYVSTFQNAFEK